MDSNSPVSPWRFVAEVSQPRAAAPRTAARRDAAKRLRMVVENLESRVMLAQAVSPVAETLERQLNSALNAKGTAQAEGTVLIAVDSALLKHGLGVSLIGAGRRVVGIRPGSSPIDQITTALAGMRGVTAVHILSHGAPGELDFSAGKIDAKSLTQNASSLAKWSKSLAPGAFIALYGCDVAEGREGEALIKALSKATRATIAASTDATGSAHLGGDWNLETIVGPNAASVQPLLLSSFEGLLGVNVTPSGSATPHIIGLGETAIDSGITLAGTGGTTTLTSATVQFSGSTFRTGEDVLAMPTTTGFSANFNSTTGVLTITSAAKTIAEYQSVLRSITYENQQNPFANLTARTITFTAGGTTSTAKTVTPTLPVDAAIQERILDALDVIDKIGQKISAVAGNPYSGDTTNVPLVGKTITDLLYPNLQSLDSNGNPVADTAHWSSPKQVGSYLRLLSAATTYFDNAGTITDLNGLKTALESALAGLVPGSLALRQVDVGFTQPAATDAREIGITLSIRTANGGTMQLLLSELERDLGLKLPTPPTIDAGGGADVKIQITIDLSGHTYGGDIADTIASSKVTVDFQRLNGLAGTIFAGLDTTAEIGAIRGTINDGSGLIAALFPISLGGSASRNLGAWQTYANGSGVPTFGTMTGAAEMTLPISASIGSVSATTANTKVVVTDGNLFDTTGFTYTTTDFSKLVYFAGVKVEDVIQQVLKVGDLYSSLDNSGDNLFGVQIPFVKDATLGDALDFKSLFDSAIAAKINVYEPVLNTPGRDSLTDYRLPLSSDSTPQPSMYSDLRAGFSFGIVVNDNWPVHTVTVAADGARATLDQLVTAVNTGLTAAGVSIVASNRNNKMVLKASNTTVQKFAVVPVAPAAARLSPTAPPSDLSTLPLNTPQYYNITGSTASGSITGTNYYTIGSTLAKAAVHAGILANGATGVVKVTRVGAMGALWDSTRNGVSSSSTGSSSDTYLVESAVNDIRRLGLVAYDSELRVLESVSSGAARATLPFQSDLSDAAEIVIKNGSTSYTVSVADNARTTMLDALADVRAALITAGIAETDLSAQFVNAAGNVIDGEPMSGSKAYLQFYLPTGSTWSSYTLATTGDATAYRVLPLGFTSGDVSAQPRPEALRTFEDFADADLFPGLTMSPVYDADAGTVTIEFTASETTNPELAAAITEDLAPLGTITLTNSTLTFSPTVNKQIAFGLEFKIGPSKPTSIASGQAIPTNGQLSGDANFTLDMVLQDRYDISIPHSWTTGNANIQDLIGDLNRGLKQASAQVAGGTVDLTADRLVARRLLSTNQFEFINATPIGSAIAVTHSSGVLSNDLAIAFLQNGKHYVVKLAAADTATNTSFADLVVDLNNALASAVYDANGNLLADDDETAIASLVSDVFFTTVSDTSGAGTSNVYLFTTSPANDAWPATITLLAARTNPAVTQLGFDDSGSEDTSSITVRASSGSAKLRNHTNGTPIAGGSVGLTTPTFSGSVAYGFNTLNFASIENGSITSKDTVLLNDGVDATVDTIASSPATYLTRTLTGGNGSGKARAGFALGGITAASGADIDEDATIQISIVDMSKANKIVDTPIGVPIPIDGTNHGRLSATNTQSFLYNGAQYSVMVTKPASMVNDTFADLAAQFNAALADCTRVVAGVTTENFDASALFSITQSGGDASLQVNAKTQTANPDYVTVSFVPGLSAFGQVGLQGGFGIATVAQAMQDVLPVLDNLQSNQDLLSTFKLPLINLPVNQLIDIKGDLLNKIDALKSMAVTSPDQIAAAVASALSVPSAFVRVTFDAANSAYRVDFQYETGAAITKPLNLTLADFYKFAEGEAPSMLTAFNDRGSASPLAVKIKAITTVSLGIDLTNPESPRTFLYGHDASEDRTLTDGSANGTSVELQIQASSDDINFTAIAGTFGVFVKGGNASLGGAATTNDDGDAQYTFDDETKQLHFSRESDPAVLAITLGEAGSKCYLDGSDATDLENYNTSFNGTVEANLPIYTPTEFINPFGARDVEVALAEGSTETVHSNGNIFTLRIEDLGAFADDAIQLNQLQSQIADIYSAAGDDPLNGTQQTQVDGLQDQIDAMRSAGDVDIFTPDVDDADSGVTAPTIIDLIRDPAIIVDGIDTALGAVGSSLKELDNLNIPIIGPALGSAVDSVFDWSRPWLADLKHQMRGRGEGVFESVKDEIFDFLGPDGLNLLLKDNGIRSVAGMVSADTPDDVTLDFLDADGNKLTGASGYGADAIEFKVRLGSVLVDTGADISFNFDALAPAFQLAVQGGLTFKLGWDVTLGFGVSMKDGFYIVTDSDPSANEMELRFEAGLSGRDTKFNVAARAGSISGYSIVDENGDWVYGPKDGAGNSTILDVMPVNINGQNVSTNIQMPDDCTEGEVQTTYWVVAVNNGSGTAVPAYLDNLGRYRPQTTRDATKMVQFNETAPFAAFGSLFAFNLTAVDQIRTGLVPKGDADYFYDPSKASTITSYGRNNAENGVNRNNSLPTRIAGRIGLNLKDPSEGSGDYVARPGPTSTGFMLMDGTDPLGGEPVLQDDGNFTPVRMVGGAWYVMEPDEDHPGQLKADHLITEDESENRITFQELTEAGLDIFELKLNAEAVLNLGLTLQIGDNANIPKLTASLNIDWRTDSMKPKQNPFDKDEEQEMDLIPEVGVNNIRLDLGSFLTKFIKPIAVKVDGALKPIDPLIDVLQTKLPVISDIAGRDIKFTTLLTTFGGGQGQAIATVIDMAILVRQLSGVMAAVPNDVNVYLPIGNFWLAKIGAGPLGRPGMGTQIYYDNNEVSAPSITQRNQSLIADSQQGANSITNALGSLDAMDKNSSSQPGTAEADRGGFQLPILQDPVTIFKLIMGQDVPLVTFSLPKLNVNFNQDIPLVKVLIFEVGLRLGLQIHGQLAMGYDTKGLRLFKDSHDPEDLLQGFYVSDRANADGTGADVDEFSMHANIALYGGVDLYLAKGGIEGGLNFNASINLNDPDNDGKLRVMEAIDLVAQTGNPLDLADLAFNGEVYARYYYWAGLKIWTPWKTYTVTLFEGGETFARATIFSFTRDGNDGPPIMAAKVTTIDQNGDSHPSSLLLNVGPNASKRVSNQDPLKVKDGAERMVIRNDPNNPSTVWVKYLNYNSSYEKQFTGISRIVAFGGEGNDSIDASGVTGLPVEIDGGAGNDTIIVNSGSATVESTIKGGGGNDTITVQGGGMFRLDGEDGNDVITAGTGTSVIDGGSGNDTITGGGSGSSNTVNQRRSFGIDRLVLNPVALINLLSFIDSTLPATANIQGASSTIYAGDTNGTLFDASAVTEIRGSTGGDTFNVTNPTTRLANAGRGLVLRGGPGNDTYNVTTDSVSGMSADGITIDDGIYETTKATVGDVTVDECGEIKSIKVATGGANYVTPPDVLITDDEGSGARAVASLDENGKIAGIFMLAGGDDYSDHPTVVFVDRTSPSDKINFKSASTGTFALTKDGNGSSNDYRMSVDNKSIKFVGWAHPGETRGADYGIDEIDAVKFDIPNASFTLSSALDTQDLLTINAHRFTQNAPITADTVRITTDLGFSANYPIAATNNGDVLIRVTGQNNSAARRATASATVVGGVITAIAVTDQGAGYDFVPTVTIEDSHGHKARAIATLSAGKITAITVLDGGESYLSAPAPRIVIAAPASIQLNTNLSSSTVGSFVGAGDGRGTVTLRAEQGAINQSGDVFFPTGSKVEWQYGDYRYTSTKSLEDITSTAYPTTLGGQGATATAVLDADGRVTGITVDSAGSGYDKNFLPAILIEGAATATAIVSDDGHITGFHITYPGEGYGRAPSVTILPNGFGKIVGADSTATAQNRNHIKSSGGTLIATAQDSIGDASKPLKTDVETMVAATYASGAGIHILEKDSLRLGLADHINGLSTNNGDVSVTTFVGPIALGAPVQLMDSSGNLLWQDANKTIPIYARDEQGNVIYQGGKIQAGEATVKLTADDVDVNSFIGASGGKLILQPVKTDASIGLKGTRATADTTIDANGRVTGFTNVWQGRGYIGEPLVTLQPPGERAFGVASVLSGQVTNINISFGGTRYSAQFPPTIALLGGGANGQTPANPATATATYTNGVVTGVTITSPGSGYVTAPEVVIALPGEQALARATVVNGQVTGFTITNPGSNYESAPDVVISAPFPFNLDGKEVDYFQDGFDDIIIGRTEGRHTFYSADASFTDGVTLRSPLGGSVQMERIQVDGPVVIVGSGHTTNLTTASPSVQGTSVEIDDNIVVHDDVDATITATAAHVSIFGAGKGKIDGEAGSTTENLLITDVGDVVVTGAIGASFPITDLTINSTGGGSINLQQSVTIDGNLHIVKGGAIAFGGNVSIGGNLVIDEGASVSFGGTLTVGGNVTISKATTVSFAQNVNVAGFFKVGDANDPTKVEGVSFASTARLDVSGAVEIYTDDTQTYGNRVGATRQPTSFIVRSELGDVSFQNTVNMPSTQIDILKAGDVTFAQQLTAGVLNVVNATGQTRLQRASTLGSLTIVSTNLIQLGNGLTITSGDASFTTNEVDFAGGTGSIVYTGEGSSTLTIKPKTASRNITLGSPPGTFTSLDISDIDLAAIGTGFANVVIGNSSAGTGTVTIGSIGSQQGVGNSQLLNATSIFGGAVNVVQNVDDAAGSGLLRIVARTGNISVDATINGTAIERNDTVQLQSLAGSINLNQPVYAGSELRLIANGSVTEGANSFVNVPSLSLDTGGDITLNHASNNVSTVGMRAVDHNISFRNDHNYAIGTVNGIAGLSSGTGNTTLIDNGGTVTQTQPITANGLLLNGTAGTFTLTNTSNNISTLAGNTGSVDFRDVDSVTIGTVAGTNGLTVSGSAQVIAGTSLAVTQPITSGNGAITLQSLNGPLTTSATGDISATGGSVSLTASTSMTLAGDINVSGGGLTLNSATNMQQSAPITASGAISIHSGGALALSTVASTNSTINIYAENNFDANGPITAAGSATILSNTAVVYLTAAGDVTADSISVTAHDGLVAAGDLHSTSGNVALSSGNALSTTGTINSAANVTSTSVSASTFAGAITAVGTVSLTSYGSTLTTTAAGDINAGSDITLSAYLDALLDGDVKSTSGKVSITSGEDLVSTGVVSAGSDITTESTATSTFTGTVTAGGKFTANAGTDFVTPSTGDITAAGNVKIDAGHRLSTDGDVKSTNGSVIITLVDSASTMGAIQSGTATTVSAKSIATGSPITAGGPVTLTATNGTIYGTAASDISATGNVEITGDGINYNGDVASNAGTVNIDSTDSVQTTGVIAAYGAVTLAADTSMGVSGNVTSSNSSVTMTAQDNLTSSASVASKTATIITSSDGAISVNNASASNGGVAITADQNIDASGVISASGPADITSHNGAVNVISTASVTGGAVTIDADMSVVLAGPTSSTNGDTTITAGTLVTTTAAMSSAAALTVNAATSATFDGAITATDEITIAAAAGTITTTANGDISGGGAVSLTAPGDITLDGTASSTGADLSIESTNGAITTNAAVSAETNASLIAHGSLNTNAAVTATHGNATLTAGTNLQANGPVTAGGDASLTAQAGTLTTTSAAPIDAGDDVTLTATGLITDNASITAGGDANITASNAGIVITAPIDADATVTIDAHGNIDTGIDADIHGDGAVSLTSTGAVAFDGDISSDATTTVTVTGNVYASAPISGATGVTVTSSTGTIAVVAVGSTDGAATIHADGDVDLNGAVTAKDVATITSDLGHVNSAAAATIEAGNVDIDAGDSVQLDATVTADIGSVTIDAVRNIVTTAAISAQTDATITSTDGAISLVAVTAHTGELVVTASDSIDAVGAMMSGDSTRMTSNHGSINVLDTSGIIASDAQLNADKAVVFDGPVTSNSGDVNISAGTVITTTAAIDSAANANITASGSITFDAAVSAATGMNIQSINSNITTTANGDITGGTTSITSSGNQTLAGDVKSTAGDTTLSASGQINATGEFDSAAALNITASGQITFAAKIKAIGAAFIKSLTSLVSTTADADLTAASVTLESDIDQNLAGDLTGTTGDITLNAGGNITTSGVISSAAKLTETADSISATAAITTNGDIELNTNDGALTTSAAADMAATTGDIRLTADTSMTLAGDVTASAGGITATSNDTLESTGVINGKNDVTLTSNEGAMSINTTTAETGELVATAEGNIDANGVLTSGDSTRLTSNAGKINITETSGINASDAELNADKSVVVSAPVTSTSGDVNISAGTVLETYAAISAADNANITAAGAITLDAALSAVSAMNIQSINDSITSTENGDITGGTVTMTSGADQTLAGDVTSQAGDITITAGDNIETTGTINATGNVTVTSTDGAIAAGPITAAAGDLSITARNGIDANAALAARDSAIIESETASVTVKSTGSVTAGDVTITADDGIVLNGAVTSSVGDTTLDAGTTLGIHADVNSAAKLTTTSTGGTWSDNALTATGAIDITAGAFTTTAGGDVSGASLNIDSNADVTTAGDMTSTTGDITVTAGEDFDATAPIVSAGKLTATAEGSMSTTSAITAAGDISLTVNGTSFGATTADADIKSTGGKVSVSAVTTAQFGGDVESTTSNITVVTGGNISHGGKVTAGGTISETSVDGKITVNDKMTATGSIILDADTSINTAAAGDIKSTGGTTSLTSGSNMTLAGDVISQAGTATVVSGGLINATGAIAGKNGVSIESTDGGVSLSTVGSNNGPVIIDADDDVTLNSTVTAHGNVEVTTRGDITAVNDITAGAAIQILTQSGDVLINSPADLDAGTDVSISANDIAIGGDVTATDGDITMIATGDLSTSGALESDGTTSLTSGGNTAIAGAVTAHDVGVHATGNIVLNAPINSETSIDMNAFDITTTGLGDLTAAAAITLGASHDLNLAGDVNAPTVTLHSTNDTSVAKLDSTGNIDVVAGHNLNAIGAITAATGNVVLDAGNILNITADADITSGGTVTLTGDAGIHTAGDVYTSGTLIKYASPVTLTGDVNLNTSRGGAGAVTFSSTVNGEYGLTAWVARDLKFLGAVGTTSRLSTLNIRNARAATFVSDANVGWLWQNAGSGPTTIMGSLSTTRAKGVSIKAAGINVVGSIISKNAGPVMLDAGTNEISLGAASLISSAGTLTINAASLKQLNGSKVYANGGSDIVVTVDNIALASAANSWNGAGKFVLQPITAGRRIDVGRAGNGFELTTDEVGGIAGGFASVVIGRGREVYDSGEESAAPIAIGDAKFRAPVVFRSAAAGGDIAVLGNLTTVGNNTSITLLSGGNITVNGSIGAQSSGNITLVADRDGDGSGDFRMANTANSTIGAANGVITLQGANALIGTATTTALIASTLGSVNVNTTRASSNVTINNTATKLDGVGVYVGGIGNYHPATASIQGNLISRGDINVYTSGNANINSFRFRAKSKLSVTAGGELKMTDGINIAQDGAITLTGKTKSISNVDSSEPSSLDLQAALGTVNLPASFKPGQKGSTAVTVTNLSNKAIDKYVTILVYTSANGRLKAGDRVLARLTTRLKLAAGASGTTSIDLQVPNVHGTGTFRIVAEVLPYAVSTSTGGSKDANLAVSSQTFTVTQ